LNFSSYFGDIKFTKIARSLGKHSSISDSVFYAFAELYILNVNDDLTENILPIQ